MILEKKHVAKLKEFGLNSYESKVWIALLSRGISTAGELSDIANVPRSRSYDVLESLEKKGFVVMKLGKPIKYIAVSPMEAIDRVKKRVRQDADEQEKMLDDLKTSEVLNQLSDLHSTGIETQDPTELTGSVRGRDSIYDHLAYQIKSAQKSVILATTKEGMVRKTKSLKRHLIKASKRGVAVKIIAPHISAKTREILGDDITYVDTNQADTRFCIIDDKQLTIMLTDDTKVHPNYDVAVWMHSPYFAKALSTIA